MARTNQMTFRQWVHEMWLQNKDELFEFKQMPYDQSEYFNKYKYWLKREYQHQIRNRNV